MRSKREWQILYYLQIDTAVEPQKLAFLTRLSYDLGVPYDQLFEFCRWADNLFGHIPMSEHCYQLEFTHESDTLAEFGIKKVNGTNLYKVCAAIAKLNEKLGAGGWVMHVERAISGCFGIDGPWSWHLRRVLDKQQREAFEDPEYVQQFAEWYVAWLNKMELESYNECGVPIQTIVWRSPSDNRMLR